MAFEKIMVVDDELAIRKVLQLQLNKQGYSVALAGDLAEARKYLQRDNFELAFVDLRLPDGEGTELLDFIAAGVEQPMYVMMTGYGTVQTAIKCMQLGAFDYMLKPFSKDQIDVMVKKAEHVSHLQKVNRYLNQEQQVAPKILGGSKAIRNVRKLIERVAPTEASVLISGESGTGKELVAAEIHQKSLRKDAPFIRVNCAAISSTLIESEFFGHEKGAFTGASQRREGRFELANGGTILLDEISEITPELQAKLLRVLQEREFERVGGTKTIRVDVRVVATTNRDMEKSVKEGLFREDLFYRLNVFPIANPPLRDRKEDIPLLAQAFIERVGRQHGIELQGFRSQTLDTLQRHEWPGNVRELQNVIERAVILCPPNGFIEPHHLGLSSTLQLPIEALYSKESVPPFEIKDPGSITAAPFWQSGSSIPKLADLERDLILTALSHTNNNRTQAANMLGITARTIRNKLSQYRDQGYVDGSA